MVRPDIGTEFVNAIFKALYSAFEVVVKHAIPGQRRAPHHDFADNAAEVP